MFLRQFSQFILGLVFLATSSLALSNTEFTYNVIGDGLEVTGCVDECPGALVIPEEIDGYVVTNIGDESFSDAEIYSLIIPDNVVRIGASAFRSNQLVDITFPDSVVFIGENAFRENLLTELIIPDNVKFISEHAFYDNFLSAVTFSDNLLTIGDYAFYRNQLSIVNLPSGILEIGLSSFKQNPLTEFNVPDHLTNQFHNSFWDSPFNYVNGSVGIESNGFKYLQLSDKAMILGCSSACSDNIIIPNVINGLTVTSIDSSAFLDEKISSVTLAESITSIGHSAFQSNELTQLSLPSNLEILGSNTFKNNQLESLILPEKLDQVSSGAFSNNELTTLLFEGGTLVTPTAFDGNPLQEVFFCGDEISTYNDVNEINNIFPQKLDSCNHTIDQFTNEQFSSFDIDQSGSVDALTDGLILLRYFFGLRGNALVNDVISPDAARTSAADIEAYIESHMP
jgi:hypothetical protein